MSDRPDFPAAHSMDTAWFAVDRDGHVALFQTGESGAVPTDAYLGEDGFAPLEALPVRGEALRVAPLPGWKHETQHGVSASLLQAAIFHLRDEGPVAAELAAGSAARVPAAGTVAVRVAAPDAALIERLHASGACLACAYHFEEADELTGAPRGLYDYEHVTENWIAGPYRLSAKPSSPARLEDLPRDVRKHVVRFEGRFDEAPLVNPPAIWPCESWEAIWIDLDGKTVRPVPGREGDYDEAAANAADGFAEEGLVFDPPPHPPAPKPQRATRRPWWKFW
ncbi:hypothetical protein [Anaeromyxobacter oryzae]|uniref:Uncharacterized protein n=1 Tax=Anaeromyxobacter oryzae TaxID=2918170 RepID=A0ABM7X122_9BACT|nr:hypothetical protein [Anaeromyxobacter oryzae]BDG05424.1 hypothetical protein AMOR_44200 [Anaeromyxobacter oryzae]